MMSVTVNSGVLTLTGSGIADSYVVTKSGSNVTVTENGGGAQSFTLASLTGILANLGGGNDTVTIADALILRSTINGGAGDDTLTAGGGGDSLNGDDGDDILDGGLGDDALDGGAGLDTVTYGARSQAVTAALNALFNVSTGQLVSITGRGGAAGESDTYTNAETLSGGQGNDSLTATAGPGNLNADITQVVTMRLNGNTGDDFLQVSGIIDGNVPQSVPREIADGGDGDDELFASYNRSDVTTLIGGNGDDLFRNIDDSLATIDAGTGVDTFEIHTVGVSAFTIPLGLETVHSTGSANFTITGNAEANRIELASGGTAFGLGGDDTIIGSSGDDVIDPGLGNDSVDGGGGNDIVTYASRSTGIGGTLNVFLTRSGTAGNYDYTFRGDGQVTTVGGETDTLVNVETLVGSGGPDAINLGAGGSQYWQDVPDHLRPTYGIAGGLGDDVLNSTSLNGTNVPNNITVNFTSDGGDGSDTLYSGAGSGDLRGGTGDDTIRVNDTGSIDVLNLGHNRVDGGDGNDLIVINGGTDTVHGGNGNDSIYAGIGDDRVFGDDGDDRLNGDGGKDTIYGGDGDDRVYGNSGADRLFGELGVDRLSGGNKNDYLDGGAGGDYVKGHEDVDTAKKDRKDRRYESIEIFV